MNTVKMRAELVNLDLTIGQQNDQQHRRYINVTGRTIAGCGTQAEEIATQQTDGHWQLVGMTEGHKPGMAEQAFQTRKARP